MCEFWDWSSSRKCWWGGAQLLCLSGVFKWELWWIPTLGTGGIGEGECGVVIQSILKSSSNVWVSVGRLVSVRGQMYLHEQFMHPRVPFGENLPRSSPGASAVCPHERRDSLCPQNVPFSVCAVPDGDVETSWQMWLPSTVRIAFPACRWGPFQASGAETKLQHLGLKFW